MWSVAFLILWIATAVAFFVYYRRQQRLVATLHRAREKLQLEETQVFDFLHGLGTALSDTSRPTDLHVLIVEGVLRILNGHGGALYLADGRDQLRPVFVSRACPPFFDVPTTVQSQAGKGAGALHGFLRLHSVRPGEGVIDSVWREREPLLLRGEDARLEPARKTPQGATSVMLVPLIYGEQNLGVLLVTRQREAEPFLTSEFQIFKAIAEQFAEHGAR
ncbi:MAG: GAF domain-containing protein, partial [Verrucomicrobiaceae bacterium]